MKKINTKNAFTLIELLVVIVIIGILAGIGVSQFNSYTDKAKHADAMAEMTLIEKAIILARINEQKNFEEITGNGCSDCACRNVSDLRNLDENHPCMTTWISSINKIAEASGIEEIPFYRDAWGSPYIFDENEQDGRCVNDFLNSPGPDGIYYMQPNGIGLADNIRFNIPFYNQKECQGMGASPDSRS